VRKAPLNSKQIQQIIPHRYPFLLVDKIELLEPGKLAVGKKNVTANEWFFLGHFPAYPLMPGVLIVESLAQVGAVALLASTQFKGKVALFAGIDNFRFKKQVRPGDQLTLRVEISYLRGKIGKGKAIASIGKEVVAAGELIFALADAVES
jgi:3-hydroxyacyl-[acyl-carrier-protein] dehydratase